MLRIYSKKWYKKENEELRKENEELRKEIEKLDEKSDVWFEKWNQESDRAIKLMEENFNLSCMLHDAEDERDELNQELFFAQNKINYLYQILDKLE